MTKIQQLKSTTLAQRQQWLLDRIYVTNYDEATCTESNITDTLTNKQKLQYVADRLESELFKNNPQAQRVSPMIAIEGHLQGLPSWLNIPFANCEILQLATEWGYNVISEKKADKFLDNYWRAVANLILQLFSKHKIQLKRIIFLEHKSC